MPTTYHAVPSRHARAQREGRGAQAQRRKGRTSLHARQEEEAWSAFYLANPMRCPSHEYHDPYIHRFLRQVSEEAVMELTEKICDPYDVNGNWIAKQDVGTTPKTHFSQSLTPKRENHLSKYQHFA